MKNIACCIFLHDITKGMKSYGSISLLKSNPKNKELLYYTISNLKQKVKYNHLLLLVGFEEEKIIKKIQEYRFQTDIITNNDYEDTNMGYAFKLAVSSIIKKYDNKNINGVLFTNGNLIIKNLPKFPTDRSWVLIEKKTKHLNGHVGCNIDNNIIKYLFYNIGNYAWTDVFYLSWEDIKIIDSNQDLYYDNMFGFEIINTAIDKQNILFHSIVLNKNMDLIKINGIKDKHKIK